MTKIFLDSIEHQCWHEVGHALTCHLTGGDVDCIEIISNSESIGAARTSCRVSDANRRDVACGGFAAEVILFDEERLDATEEEFINSIFRNATYDMRSYFGKDMAGPGGFWPDEHNSTFLHHAAGNVAHLLKPHVELMERMVSELVLNRKLERKEISKFFASIQPASAPQKIDVKQSSMCFMPVGIVRRIWRRLF